jgi:hypothetical protein
MKYLKAYQLFEGYPPHKFEIDSQREFKQLHPDVKDILLEVIDSGAIVDINKYIDDVIFEFQIEIEKIESVNQKQTCEDSLFRLEEFLSNHNFHLAKIEMVQFESGWRHDFELYDMSELSDLKNTVGLLNILIYFAKHTD